MSEDRFLKKLFRDLQQAMSESIVASEQLVRMDRERIRQHDRTGIAVAARKA
jgi:hypothetical protein